MTQRDKFGALAMTAVMVLAVFATGALVGTAAGNHVANHAANQDAGDVPDDNRSENATDAFGLQVSEFVHSLLASNDTSNESIGQQVSAFVTANNPGADKRPDHAGPDGNETQGPPDHAGGNGNGADAEAGGNGNGNGGGPPEHAKND